jgi:hypothetical protein
MLTFWRENANRSRWGRNRLRDLLERQMPETNCVWRIFRIAVAACVTACSYELVIAAEAQAGRSQFECPEPDTYPTAINAKGIIVGWCYYGPDSFIRYSDGTMQTFAIQFATTALDVNRSDKIIGYYVDQNSVFHGFERFSNGRITTLDPPDSIDTNPVGINDDGYISGWYVDTGHVAHGFLMAPNGTFTSFDVPHSQGTVAQRINIAGSIVGHYWDGATYHGFVRGPDGTIATFDPSGSTATYAYDVNATGIVTGTYEDSNRVGHGFIRSADGTITVFDPDSCTGTEALSINDAGTVTGSSYCGRHRKAFIRTALGATRVFLEEPREDTYATRINSKGHVTGYFSTPDGTIGFVR